MQDVVVALVARDVDRRLFKLVQRPNVGAVLQQHRHRVAVASFGCPERRQQKQKTR